MMALTKEELLAERPMATERVHVYDLGGDVYVRQLTALEADQWESGWERWRAEVNGDRENAAYCMEYLLAWCLCDETGRAMLDPCNHAEVKALAGLPARSVRLLWRKVTLLNGLGAAAQAELAKNSESGPSGSSASG
jgi:hypothetical protein